MDINTIRERVVAGNYLIKSHAVSSAVYFVNRQHDLKEGFEHKQIVEAIFKGIITEEYPDDRRALICGTTLFGRT